MDSAGSAKRCGERAARERERGRHAAGERATIGRDRKIRAWLLQHVPLG